MSGASLSASSSLGSSPGVSASGAASPASLLERVQVAIIGFGFAGRVFHAPLIAAEPRLQLRTVVTSSPERGALARSEYAVDRVLDRAEDFLAEPGEVDLAVIAGPNETHAPLAVKALRAGLHVVVDKPVALTSAQAMQVQQAAQDSGRLAMVFQNRRWDGDYLTIKAALEAGLVGEVYQFDSAFEWYAPSVGGGWKDTASAARGGGIFFDLGPHLVDQALQLFGQVEQVHAELDRRRHTGGSDDDSFVCLRHANGVRTRLWASAIAPANRPRFRILGSRGVLETVGLDPQEEQSLAGRRPGQPGFGVFDDGRAATLTTPDGAVALPLRAGDHAAFYRQVADALTTGGPAPVPVGQTLEALQLIEQAYTQAWQ